MAEARPIPTLYEWMGGMPAISKLLETFYRRVPSDPLLAPVFAQMSPEHSAHVADFIAEVLGGPKRYSGERGGHAHMIERHLGRALTDTQRKRWLSLLLDCADEIGVRADPEFRSAFVAYLEWGTRRPQFAAGSDRARRFTDACVGLGRGQGSVCPLMERGATSPRPAGRTT